VLVIEVGARKDKEERWWI